MEDYFRTDKNCRLLSSKSAFLIEEPKTRARSRHWITQGEGQAYSLFSSTSLTSQIKLALSVKVEAANGTLQSISVDSYRC